MKRWYDEIISRTTANDFFAQCRERTTEFVQNYCPELMHIWPLSNKLPAFPHGFNPEGAIIHISEAPSLWTSLNMLARHIYTSHFLVLSDNHLVDSMSKSYPLVRSLPSQVLMLHDLDASIPHSGYLSSKSWGIELRNSGRVRPFERGHSPPPLTSAEETDANFKRTPGKLHDYFWRPNLWRYPFQGNTIDWENYAFEAPTTSQFTSLAALLRCLHTINELDTDLIIPSNCVSGSLLPKLPTIPWDLLREIATTPGYIMIDPEHIDHLDKQTTPWEVYELDWEDESLQRELMELSRWRGSSDDGEIDILQEFREYDDANAYKRAMARLGYNPMNMDFAFRLWAVSKGLGLADERDVYSRLESECPLYKTASKR